MDVQTQCTCQRLSAFNAVEPEAQKRYANIARFLHLEGSTDAELVDALIAHIKGMNAAVKYPDLHQGL